MASTQCLTITTPQYLTMSMISPQFPDEYSSFLSSFPPAPSSLDSPFSAEDTLATFVSAGAAHIESAIESLAELELKPFPSTPTSTPDATTSLIFTLSDLVEFHIPKLDLFKEIHLHLSAPELCLGDQLLEAAELFEANSQAIVDAIGLEKARELKELFETCVKEQVEDLRLVQKWRKVVEEEKEKERRGWKSFGGVRGVYFKIHTEEGVALLEEEEEMDDDFDLLLDDWGENVSSDPSASRPSSTEPSRSDEEEGGGKTYISEFCGLAVVGV